MNKKTSILLIGVIVLLVIPLVYAGNFGAGTYGSGVYGTGEVAGNGNGGNGNGGNGGGGGGGATTSAWTKTYTVDDEQCKKGYTKELVIKERFKVKINNTYYYIGVVELTETTVTINISSKPQTTLSIGETKKFDVTNDSFYNIQVTLNNIENNKANLTIKCIYEKIPLFDIEINIITKEVSAGDEVIAEIELIKTAGEKKIDVDVHYSIKDMEGNVLAMKRTPIAVDVKTSFLARLNVPKNLEPNIYIFYVEIIYGEERWHATNSFKVIKKTIEIPTSIILGILIAILLIFILILYYEYKRTKKLTKLIKKVTEKDLRKYKLIKRR